MMSIPLARAAFSTSFIRVALRQRASAGLEGHGFSSHRPHPSGQEDHGGSDKGAGSKRDRSHGVAEPGRMNELPPGWIPGCHFRTMNPALAQLAKSSREPLPASMATRLMILAPSGIGTSNRHAGDTTRITGLAAAS